MKAWTRMAGRPIGREPAVWLIKPPEDTEELNPWSWEVEEWSSVAEAFNAVFDYCPQEEYRNEFRIISKIPWDTK